MSLSVEGQTCPVCHAYLFDEDDIVYCPVCGAPHHRTCYQAVGHCALEDKHGTPEQYTRPVDETPKTEPRPESRAVEHCRGCGRPLDPTANICPYCRTPRNITPPGGEEFGVRIDLLGGVPPETKIEDATAEEVRQFTLLNSQRYVPKFASLSKKNKVSWNWAAFLLPHGWLFFRKMYKQGILVSLLMIASAICALPLTVAAQQFITEDVRTSYQLASLIMENLSQIGVFPILMLFVGSAISLGTRIVCGLFGDYLYRGHTLAKIREIKSQDNDDLAAELGRRGSANPLMFAVGIMAVSWVPNLIAMFL